MKKKLFTILLALTLIFTSIGLTSCGTLKNDRPDPSDIPKQEEEKKNENNSSGKKEDEPSNKKEEPAIDKDGTYSSKEDVALYIWTYGKLPSNFITKKEAQKLGWEGGGLDKYAKGKSIGGDKFGNYEGLLPKNYNYYECDIDTKGKKERGAKRIVFAEGGKLVYYTEDHYKSFELLYGTEGK